MAMPPTCQETVKILLVDDIEKNLVATEALLARPGLEIVTARSGVQALELLLDHEVALALIDVNMPEMDGFELAGLMRGNTRTRSIPLIFITAALQEPARAFRGYEAGAVDFLNKPFHPEILRSKVDVFVELYRQRKQLELHAEELKQALSVNEMYNAVLGHDLRSPLQAILNGVEVITLSTDQPKVLSAARRIRSSGMRMANMVDQLLEVARVRSGDIQLNLSDNSYHAVCEQIVQEYSIPGATDSIGLIVEGNPRGCFDKDRVARVFSNLIGNAVQHRIPDTFITVRIDGSGKDQVVIQVRNKGHIPASELESIFQAYHSGTQKKRTTGLGLGLYIVKRLVDAHGGDVRVRSTYDQNVCFEVCMPRNIAKTGAQAGDRPGIQDGR